MPLASNPALESRSAPDGAPIRSVAESFELREYELLSLAGRGTFADVWQVRDRRTGRILAIKQLRPDRADQPAARRILENEAEVGSRAAGEFVVQVIQRHLNAAPPFLVLEWLGGRTLEAHLADRKRLFCREAIWIARQCAQGLHALLVAGYTHGDLKPSNIFLLNDGRVKLIDLGFARADRHPAADLAELSERPLTGTPDYLAPEALMHGDPGGIQRDVYSLGVTLYRMLTGTLPFTGDTVADVLRQHQQSLPTRLRTLAPDVPREVSNLVQRLLSKQPMRRGEGLSSLIREFIGSELSFLDPEPDPATEEYSA